MRRVGIYSFEIPYSFGCTREVISEKSSTIFSVKNCSETPFVSRQRPQIAYLDGQEIAGLGRSSVCIDHSNRSTQIMNLMQYISIIKISKQLEFVSILYIYIQFGKGNLKMSLNTVKEYSATQFKKYIVFVFFLSHAARYTLHIYKLHFTHSTNCVTCTCAILHNKTKH